VPSEGQLWRPGGDRSTPRRPDGFLRLDDGAATGEHAEVDRPNQVRRQLPDRSLFMEEISDPLPEDVDRKDRGG
jgi:hypothetical protein